MNICIIGFGSIANRHKKNLNKIYGDACSIDVLRRDYKYTPQLLKGVSNIFFSWEQIRDDYDAIFITNPTFSHYDTLKTAVCFSKNIFIEKPVFDSYRKSITELKLTDDGVYYVACPLRYTRVIQYLKNKVDFNHIYSIRAISSSYLPDWRKDDYRQSYSAKKELGGGVSLDLIHEWDYICYLVGFPNYVKCIKTKISSLDINTDDTAIYIAEYANKTVELHLDYYGRKPVRKIEMIGEDDTIIADLIEQSITYLNEGKKIQLKETRDSYQKKELIHFFDIIDHKIDNDNDIFHAMKVLRLAMGDW